MLLKFQLEVFFKSSRGIVFLLIDFRLLHTLEESLCRPQTGVHFSFYITHINIKSRFQNFYVFDIRYEER